MMRALDLYCGAGGASKGLQLAGYEVDGVDLKPQPSYPFSFQQYDALQYLQERLTSLSGYYDLIWASPPCQAFTAYRRRKDHVGAYPNLIPETRKLLRESGVPFIIENVPGAPLDSPITLCGSMFGLDVRRHRCFEASFPIHAPCACRHDQQRGDYPQATNRKNRRKTVEVGVWRIPLPVQRAAMGVSWMSREELSQAIPPAYSEHLGRIALSLTRRDT